LALPYLVKYVYNNGTDEVIRRGKKIHSLGFVELVEHDELSGAVAFRVKDDSYATYYKVNIQKYKDDKSLNLRCGCPYNLGDICRHEAAALFQLQELLDKNMLSGGHISYNQQHTLIKMKQIDLKTVKMLSSQATYIEAEQFLRTQKATIEKAADEKVLAKIEMEGQVYPVVIRKNEERNFDTSCPCADTEHPLCVHKAILFIQLLNNYGTFYFDSIRNWDNDKNKLLAAYGYTLDDDLKGKFDFAYKDGKPFLRVLDVSIKRIAVPGAAPRPAYMKDEPLQSVVAQKEKEKEVAEEEEMPPAEINNTRKIGLVFNFNHTQYPYFTVDVVEGEADETGLQLLPAIEKIDIGKYVNAEIYDEANQQILQLVRKLHTSEITRFLNRNSPFARLWDTIVQDEGSSITEESKELALEYIFPKMKHLFGHLQTHPFIYYLPKGKAFKTAQLKKITAAADFIEPSFKVNEKGSRYELTCQTTLHGHPYGIDENECGSSCIFLHHDELFLWKSPDDILLVEDFNGSAAKQISKKDWPETLQKKILPLTRNYKVDFDKALVKEVKEGVPERKIVLQEKGDYLMFLPVFTYKDYQVKENDKDEIVVAEEGRLVVVNRNKEVENAFIEKIESLHSNFIRPDGSQHLVLKGADVLRNNWFFLFIDTMKELNVPVQGFEVLKNFRFNTARPSTKIFINSNTDWFDAKVEISFDGQQITVADVKKALANKQQFVQLADGTLGVLPEEWLKRYSLLFRMGEGRTDKLRISKYHFNVIDELYEAKDEAELIFQLEEKYDNLRNNYRIKEIAPPDHLATILRPYQVAGYQWLNYLSEVGWGGILADDMGLGKTVQALSFLHQFQQQHQRLLALVVCPTTLIFNWENEIKKFTPGLTRHIHHGGDRIKTKELFASKNIIITTYGTLRSDIKFLVDLPLDYVVLDESQAIKNPMSKVTRAASLLNAKHKLCLSGTPLQNNTFDIFAQMHFLNPGMLGSIDHFRNEFSIPIDKFGDSERKDHLRKVLYPFILRRTKEQVAKDLPDKTEMILWCEMGEEQRNIYEAWRNDYRDKILGTIESRGLQKSQLTILQGLMKLRQICDSPAIMNDTEQYPNVSVKIDELVRELTENISDHKALIFSQFLGMLALIKAKLTEMEIPFEYFDGSTSASDRNEAIQNFQGKDHVRVFLISLKAGGVGLNLTAADYVYIVDPWWNPAVEQQAIDRTHRIGQTKNIFAYRMICKDTVEDKIVQLQEKKRALAKDIVADDDTFVKALSKEDVEYLFG
jgi:SNF2 family DNA or RNA helicase